MICFDFFLSKLSNQQKPEISALTKLHSLQVLLSARVLDQLFIYQQTDFSPISTHGLLGIVWCQSY